MKNLFVLFMILSLSAFVKADHVFRIEFNPDFKSYSESDLKRKIWELERAVWQLQQKVFDLEKNNKPTANVDTWVCQIKTISNTTIGTGPTKATATARVFEKCKDENKGDGFFCKNPKCEQ